MLTLGSEDNLQESVFFHYVGPKNQAWVLSFGGKHLYFAEPFCQLHLFIEAFTKYFPRARFYSEGTNKRRSAMKELPVNWRRNKKKSIVIKCS